MAIFGRKWLATAAVYLTFYAIALIWLVWLFDIQDQPPTFRSLITRSDDELQRLLKDLHNASWLSSSTTCMEFLLEGAAGDPIANHEPGVFQWEGGEWFAPPEAFDSTWVQRSFVQDADGLHEATFSITPGASVEVEWGNLTTLEGRLVFKEFWNTWMEDSDLKVMLHGAFVSTGVDRRVCMTGCALRLDYPDELPSDCGFILKMKYPNHPSLTTSRVEGELSSQRRPGDPLHFRTALRFLGPRAFTGSEYEFRSEEFLQTALNMSSSNIDNNGSASPQDLVSYLEGSGVEYTALVAPTPSELSQLREQGKLVVGPFSSHYPFLVEWQDVPSSPTLEQLVLRFKSVVTRVTGKRVLVTASMTVLLFDNIRLYYVAPLERQTLFNMEGIWDPGSEELCMLGSREAEILPWKLCLKSVLGRHVSIDSTLEGAVLSGPNFTSLALLRTNSHQLTYNFTVAAKAEELARRAPSPEVEALKDTRWFRPRLPFPADVPAAEKLSVWMCPAYSADGEIMDVCLLAFTVTFLESCGVIPVAGSYLRVAARLSLTSMSRATKEAVFQGARPRQCHAEGVYEPFTGKLHLVVHQRQSERIDGVGVQPAASPWPLERNAGADVEAVEDSEMYMQVQFSSVSAVDEEMLFPDPEYEAHHDRYGKRRLVNVKIESLRSQSHPLYFKPLVVRNYPPYKPSPHIIMEPPLPSPHIIQESEIPLLSPLTSLAFSVYEALRRSIMVLWVL